MNKHLPHFHETSLKFHGRINRRQRRLSWILPAFITALIINGFLFLLPPLLSHTRSSHQDITAPIPLSAVLVRETETLPDDDEEMIPPEPERFQETVPSVLPEPELVMPLPPSQNLPAPEFNIDVGLITPSGPGFQMSFNAGELDQPPRIILRIPPLYPYKAKRMGVEGYVKVRFLVDEKGKVSRISILDSSPEGMFEQSVLNMLPSWKFEPGKIMGDKVSSWVEIPVRFELR